MINAVLKQDRDVYRVQRNDKIRDAASSIFLFLEYLGMLFDCRPAMRLKKANVSCRSVFCKMVYTRFLEQLLFLFSEIRLCESKFSKTFQDTSVKI